MCVRDRLAVCFYRERGNVCYVFLCVCERERERKIDCVCLRMRCFFAGETVL